MDCDYKPNDIIPIAVGVALAALVVAVLVAYIVGRNRGHAGRVWMQPAVRTPEDRIRLAAHEAAGVLRAMPGGPAATHLRHICRTC